MSGRWFGLCSLLAIMPVQASIVRTIGHGEQLKSLKSELTACKHCLQSPSKLLPRVAEFEIFLNRVNGYAGAHDMKLREVYGPKGAEVVRALKNSVQEYRQLVKAQKAKEAQQLVESIQALIDEWVQYRASVYAYAKNVISKRPVAELYAQFFDTAIAAVQRIKGLITQKIMDKGMGK